MQEIWKDIVGYEGLYQVSNFGRVKSLRRTTLAANGARRNYPEKILTPFKNKTGYLSIQLYFGHKNVHKLIHRIMAESFIPNPKKLDQVNHKNGIKNDNSLNNLEWISRRGNALHAAYELGIVIGNNRYKKVRCLETNKDYPSIRSAARSTNIPITCLKRVLRGERKDYCGLHWKFI